MKHLLCSAFLTASFLLPAGELLNRNAGMELGIPGKGAPGYFLCVNRAALKTVQAAPDKIYTSVTVGEGKDGQGLMIPGYSGVSHWQLELADFMLTRDGEVEISFDAKVLPDENGKLQPLRAYSIDFRAFPDQDRDHYYPMLKAFSFRPGTEWKHFSKRFKVKAYTNYYNIWVLAPYVPSGTTLNALCLDNFRFEYVDSAPAPVPEEYSVIPDRGDQLYSRGDLVAYTVRARLNDARETVEAKLVFKREYNDSPAAIEAITLKRGKDGTYTGEKSFALREFGSFTTELMIAGKKLRGIDTSIQVMHPAVKHPFGSFGWGLGMNDEGGFPIGRAGKEGVENYSIMTNSFEREFRLMKAAGANMMRVWARWRLIEPEAGKFTASLLGLQMELLKKYDIEPLFVLMGGLVIHGGQATMDKYLAGNIRGSQWPEHLFRYYYQSERKNAGSILPPMDYYAKYLDFVYKTWGGQVRCWEMTNEPGVFGVPAKNYIDYQKFTYDYLKRKNPENLLIGNGVTGDFGMNVVKWCDQLNAVDRNYVDTLDGVAFHPYACGLDYIHGARGLYAQCIRNIQNTLAKPKPMWCTELYYIQTARRKQINHGRDFSRYDSNDLLRHFLDGIYNGVKASPSPAVDSFFQTPDRMVNLRGMTQLAAAMNSLSFLLTDMVNFRKIDLGSLVRAGMFTDKSGTKALGFLYDMRPSGSLWTPGAGSAQILDLYGNPLAAGTVPLGFEPRYLTGAPAEVERMLSKSTFKVANPVELFGRFFNDELYMEADNRTGSAGIVDAGVGDLPVRFAFENDPEHAVIHLAGVKTAPANVKTVAKTPAYTLPATVKLSRGTTAHLSAGNGTLKLELSVADPSVKAAEGNSLWGGSAVEVFLDPSPFRELSRDAVKPYQYAFAAVPSKGTGMTALAIRNPATKASRKVEKTADGYRMEILIPLDELPPAAVYGFDIEISRPGEKTKESLGANPGNSFRYRLHYHLFRLPEGSLPNGDFSQVSFGDPAAWCYEIRSGVSFRCAPEFGRTGNGMKIEVRKPDGRPAVAGQRFKIEPGRFSYGVFQILARYENVQTLKSGRGRNGVRFSVGFPRGRAEYGYDKLKTDTTGSSDWTLYQLEFKIPADADYLVPEFGFGPATTGALFVDSATLTLYGDKK